ncbi:MAG: arginase family protein [Aggregatilineales bacterium]
MSIFDDLQPVNPDVFYQRNDPNDVRLGEVVMTEQSDYASAEFVLIGCPQDDGVQRNKGRIGAAAAPAAIRRALYKLVAPANVSLFDAGNTRIQPSLEETHTVHTGIIRQMIADGKRIISLGGGNDVSYADCAGLAEASETVLALNIDAHFDVRADEVRNSGTPYRQLLEEGLIQPDMFYEVGSLPMSNSTIYRDYLLHKGAHIIDLFSLKAHGINTVFDKILATDTSAIFWGLDMDVVNVAHAPGVSAINVLGLSAGEFCQIAAIAGADKRSRIFEITEVNPVYDIDDRTARLAGAAIYHFLSQSII